MSLHGNHRHKRGDRIGRIQLAILQLLRIEQMHGYQIIKQLEEKAEGLYSPSAGTVYPALQELHDKGLIDIDEQKEKKVYFLNENGKKHVQDMGLESNEFWTEWRRRLAWKQSEQFKMLREELDKWEQELHAAKKQLVRNPARTEELLAILAEARKQVSLWTQPKDSRE
ncbi:MULTISPECIES: PadR family transcriptional regulator [unclassified Paenibacillus]|uniref:PadR family transcriptional regulator n=1 Tax=unclassified Paenibacillus TaxID=185978 RepID=UPI00363C1B2E